MKASSLFFSLLTLSSIASYANPDEVCLHYEQQYKNDYEQYKIGRIDRIHGLIADRNSRLQSVNDRLKFSVEQVAAALLKAQIENKIPDFFKQEYSNLQKDVKAAIHNTSLCDASDKKQTKNENVVINELSFSCRNSIEIQNLITQSSQKGMEFFIATNQKLATSWERMEYVKFPAHTPPSNIFKDSKTHFFYYKNLNYKIVTSSTMSGFVLKNRTSIIEEKSRRNSYEVVSFDTFYDEQTKTIKHQVDISEERSLMTYPEYLVNFVANHTYVGSAIGRTIQDCFNKFL